MKYHSILPKEMDRDMTTGHDITTRIINIVLAEQIDITPIQEKIIGI